MKVLCSLCVVTLSVSALADEQCRLSGVFKSDEARTLADIVAADGVPPGAMNVVSDDLFGHMTHEWECGRTRSWFDYDEPGQWHEYKVLEHTETSVLITFPDGSESDLRLVFEGACYKIRFGDRKYHEYFCPVE